MVDVEEDGTLHDLSASPDGFRDSLSRWVDHKKRASNSATCGVAVEDNGDELLSPAAMFASFCTNASEASATVGSWQEALDSLKKVILEEPAIGKLFLCEVAKHHGLDQVFPETSGSSSCPDGEDDKLPNQLEMWLCHQLNVHYNTTKGTIEPPPHKHAIAQPSQVTEGYTFKKDSPIFRNTSVAFHIVDTMIITNPNRYKELFKQVDLWRKNFCGGKPVFLEGQQELDGLSCYPLPRSAILIFCGYSPRGYQIGRGKDKSSPSLVSLVATARLLDWYESNMAPYNPDDHKCPTVKAYKKLNQADKKNMAPSCVIS